MHIYIHIYLYLYIHTYIYIYTYIYARIKRAPRAHWALVGPHGRLWAGPLWAPWAGTCGPPSALMGWALMGLCYEKVALVGKISR